MTGILYAKKTIPFAKILGSPQFIGHREFDRCEFEGGVLSQREDPTCDFVVRNIVASRCKVGRTVIHGVTFDEVTVDTLTRSPGLDFAACLFRHVTLRGKLGSIGTGPPYFRLSDELKQAFLDEAARFYEKVDWALDISEAEFSGAGLTYVPGDLVRRNPETQFLVHKDRASSLNLDTLPDYAMRAVDMAVRSPYASVVAVAASRSKYFDKQVEDLSSLRDLGVAE